ncbi:MAG: nuclear transport factor 2 family protein, partial [Chloroflexi bacterium]|nr:nuclear transport factor 2 family protein [Chloroflexota bacterium]
MMQVWWHSPDVTIMHPTGGLRVGWGQVQEWWEQVVAFRFGGHVVIISPLLWVVGDLAYEVGIESGEHFFQGQPRFFGHRVTNIYRREAGIWKMVHHHTDLDVGMVKTLKDLHFPLGQDSS